MIKSIEFFALVWFLVAFGIIGFVKLTARAKWAASKIALYGFITAAITTALVVGMVFAF